MLETTLATEFVPGTNLRGDLGCADWRYLLPSLRADAVLYVGAPAARTVEVLSSMGSRVYVVLEHGCTLQEDWENRSRQMDNCLTVRVDGFSNLPFPDLSMDLIFLADENTSNTVFRNHGAVTELGRLLKPRGAVYFEIQGLLGRFISDRGLRVLSRQGFSAVERFWLAPVSGDMRAALPLKGRNISTYFFEHVLYGKSNMTKVLSWAGGTVDRLGLMRYIAPRRGVVVHRSYANGQLRDPPEYLRPLAEKAGIELSRFTYGFSARGKFNANKVMFFLFEESAKLPSAVIKMTRAPEFNFRLENEYRVLKELTSQKFIDTNRYPEPVFFGHHNNLAVSCLKAVYGTTFRTRTRATADCSIARDAIECIVQLGTASVNRAIASSGDVSRALGQLYERFGRIYKLSASEDRFLVEQLGFNGCIQKDFPLVFQHGDPGTWNILVSKQDKVILMDWEAGELRGMPLWDLFYFLRTYASWVSRVQGSRDSLKNFSQHFLEPSALGILLRETTNRYCGLIGLDKKMIESLFYTCWMHRALKEAARLPKASLDSGHYINLLRLVIENRNTLMLEHLFSL